MTTEQTIPLNQLVHSKANVRQTGRTDGIGELAASIAAHGLRQNLNVQPCEDGRHFEVVAGGRRLRAMKLLAKSGRLAKDAPITCLVLGDADDPAEISLVENALRTAMHPDDQFEAFRALIEDKGASVEDVAARFGVSPAVVRQRLKLANVSPKLRRLFRQGEMGLDHVMALAISDDHAAQEKAWKGLPEWDRDPSTLKAALTHEQLPMTDRLAKFIGVDTYIAAGGAVLRDLFDDKNQGYLSDRALVMSLAAAKLEQAVGPVKAEGWKWVKPELTRDHGIPYGRIWPSYDGEDNDEAGESTFAPDDMAQAGVFLRVGHDGTLQVERGYIHPDDAKASAKRQGVSRVEGTAQAGFSAAVIADLTAHRTAALRIELARKPAIALAMTVQALASPLFYHGQSASCLDLRAGSADLGRHTKVAVDSPAHQAMADECQRWAECLPEDADGLMAWCLGQTQEVLLELLAFLAALTVDAVQAGPGKDRQHQHAEQLAATLSLDMTRWWTPSVEGFYQRLPKAALLQAVTDAKVTADAPFASVKKDAAARMAAKTLKDSGWLPEVLRLSA